MDNHNFENEGKLQRKMTSRHLFMLSLGGVIGTGLFMTSGQTVKVAGPFGSVLAYLAGSIIVYLVMLSLGELAVAMPVTGSFHTYATKFISPGSGFAVAWLYWLCWTFALGSEFLGAGIIMHDNWFPNIPSWVFALVFALIVFAINALSTRSFAEAESFFSGIKVMAIIIFIILGLGAMFGLVTYNGENRLILFENYTKNGLWPKNLPTFLSVMLAVNYAFSGTELIGIAAGETENPKETVPAAIKTTIGRLVLFFIVTIIVLAALLPMNEAGVNASFAAVFSQMGIPYAGDIMNIVVLIAILSAGNSGLYASSRMLWSLANEGMISKKVVKVNKHGVPMRALVISMVGALLCLLASRYEDSFVFLALTSVASFAVGAVWLSIPLAQISFRKKWRKTHTDDELDYKTPFTPVLPWITVCLLLISIFGGIFDSAMRVGIYFGLPFTLLCYLYHYIKFKKF
ncbi:amino acid permease [Streptococcus dentiloxodontae]